MKTPNIHVLVLAIATSVTMGCESKSPPAATGAAAPGAAASPTEKADDKPEHVELPTKVHLSEAVVRSAQIHTTAVTTEVLPVTMDLTGEVAFDPDQAAHITARVPGRVVDIRFREGDHIKTGAPLVIIESPQLAQSRAAFTSASSKAQTARQNAGRLIVLADKGLSSGQEVAMAQAEARTAEADERAALQTLAVFGFGAQEQSDAGARLTLFAPIDGFALSRNAVRGQTVVADTLLATLANFDEAYFLGRLFEKDLALVTVASVAEVRLNAYPAMVFAGTVESVGRQLDPSARTVVARIRIKDRDALLKAGLFGTARLSTGKTSEQAKSLVVPLTAVTKIGDRDVVFVQEAGGEFDIHPVTVGRSAEGKVQILAGLNPAERVVDDGVFVLKSAALKSTFGEEE